ncbi:MAG: cardiolipin synthase [Eubacteriales bacterium]|nr:cardiolipin synthase [Eubacteriales bacterium]
MKNLLELLLGAVKSIIKLLFNRIFYVVVALLVQLGWILVLVWRLNTYSRVISSFTTILALVAVLKILNNDINPSYKLAWTILILTVPIFGLAFYLLFGKSRVAEEIEKRSQEIESETRSYLLESPHTRRKLFEKSPSMSRQSEYIHTYSGYPLQENTQAEYFTVGDDMFPVMIQELKAAKHYIFIEYFIINDGVMWNSILDILEEKASQGVDVRLLYDGFGCLTTLPHNYAKHIRTKGIKCYEFNPFRPFLNIVQNNRDHRKICVIDGYTGFTGGVNLADEYINQKERFGHWKDTAVMLKGDAVWNFTLMFLRMWSVISGEPLGDLKAYMPHQYHPEEFQGQGFVQPYCDTPLDNEIVGENVYLNIINRSRQYVYICTPYLIIDNEMSTALCLAAKSGVDVRIMTPGIPDKKIVFLLTKSYYQKLLEAGVRIYEYQPGFLHAKSFVADDEVGVVGTINMDYRSLYLHFEDGVWMYESPAVLEIKQDFEETLEFCHEVTLEACKSSPWPVRLMQSILRLFAPML